MNSVINGIVATLMLLGAGALTSSFYYAVKKKALIQINRGVHLHLTGFTRKLTGTKSK